MRSVFVTLSLIPALMYPRVAAADEVKWLLKKAVSDDLQIVFYSKSRPGLHWPGSGAFNLSSNQETPITLTCEPAEKICYGAWVTHNKNVSWGVGLGGSSGCTDCCTQCGTEKSVRFVPAAPTTSSFAVKAFKWTYNAQPSPGVRSWYRDDADHWHERYPDGSEQKIFTEVTRGSANGCEGGIASGGDGDLQIFIPDTNCPRMAAMFRRGAGSWSSLGSMFDIR